MKFLKLLGIMTCFRAQGIITLRVMVVIPIAWLFFGWSGPIERVLGNTFAWSLADGILWLFAAIVAMIIVTAQGNVINKLSTDAE